MRSFNQAERNRLVQRLEPLQKALQQLAPNSV